MEKKYKAKNGLGTFLWGIAAILLLGIILYYWYEGSKNVWTYILYFVFAILFSVSTTIKEYAITELNFLEIRFVLKLFAKNRRIPLGDIIGLKKLKKNRLRLDLIRGFEILKVKESDMDALIAELTDRNPRIKIAKEKEES